MVVNAGELINIDVEQSCVEAIPFRTIHSTLQMSTKTHSIEHPGKRIGIRQLSDLLASQLELNVVLEDAVHECILQLPADKIVLGSQFAQMAKRSLLGVIQHHNKRGRGIVLVGQA